MNWHDPLPASESRRLAIMIAKTAAWEEAKAKLRTVVALSGSYESIPKFEHFREIKTVVEDFIKKFEEEGHHEA
jgi:hypothetical protein